MNRNEQTYFRDIGRIANALEKLARDSKPSEKEQLNVINDLLKQRDELLEHVAELRGSWKLDKRV